VVAVGEVPAVAVAVFDDDGADRDELFERPVDGVLGGLVQPVGQRGPAGHAAAGGLAVAEQHRVQPVRAVADVGVDDPLRDDREALFEDERAFLTDAVKARVSHGVRPGVAGWTGNAMGTQLRA